jgi:hypothetical protein
LDTLSTFFVVDVVVHGLALVFLDVGPIVKKNK